MTGGEQCPSCGEWIGADATWCMHCGSAVEAATDAGERGGEGTDTDTDAEDDQSDDDGPSVGRLEVALHFVNRYEWLRGAFAVAVLAAMQVAVAAAGGPRYRTAAMAGATVLVWLYAVSRPGTKRILVAASYGTAGLLVLARLSGLVPYPLASDPGRAVHLAVHGPTLVAVAALIVGAQLLSTLVVQPPDPYGVREDID